MASESAVAVDGAGSSALPAPQVAPSHAEAEETEQSRKAALFGVDTDSLDKLFDPKDIQLLQRLGGTEGVLKNLHIDADRGLSEKDATPSIADRVTVFGENRLPVVKAKNIFQLMWIAMHDKILILLSVAAIVSLGIGIYQDVSSKSQANCSTDEVKLHWVEGCAILIAVLVVVMAGSLNDYQKERQFRKLNAKNDDRNVKVFRDGKQSLISVYSIVAGDILCLEPGDVIVADGLFLSGSNVKCDESAATGETDALKKSKEKDPFILSGSKVLEGVGRYFVTNVGVHSFYGKTMMALRTENEETPLQMKLNAIAENIAKLGAGVAALMLFALILKYVIITLKNEGFGPNCQTQECGSEAAQQVINMFITTIAIVVVAVPEGLPLAVTLALAFAMTRMQKDNNLVRQLQACETMGGATCICSDKTGTLTQNEMTVVKGTIGRSISFESEAKAATLPETFASLKKPADADFEPQHIFKVLIENCALNSSAFEGTDERTKETTLIGSKTECALLKFASACGEPFRKYRESLNKETVQVYPFASEHKSMATIVKILPAANSEFAGAQPDGKPFYRVYVKGASEIVLKYCSHVISIPSCELKPNDPTTIVDYTNNVINRYAEQALRTICLAYRDYSEEEFDKLVDKDVRARVLHELEQEHNQKYQSILQDTAVNQVGEQISSPVAPATLPAFEPGTIDTETLLSHPVALSMIANSKLHCLGIVGIEDPLRPGVPEAVRACQRAGVTVRMVTGDNVLTAKSIASRCGIYSRNGIVMEGPKFRKLSVPEMDIILPNLQVLARSSPMDKQILVGRLKALGETVAVTGDGTNDGPALKMADVGFAMGIAGTEVAKEASAIILMDDNFSSIVKAIMWGRSVNDSVKKFLQFQLTVNITAVVIAFVSAIADKNESSVLTAVQLLWVNLIMDTLAALALATDPPTPSLLNRPPESKRSALITGLMWRMILGQAVYQIAVGLTLYFAGQYILSLSALSQAGGMTAVPNELACNASSAARDAYLQKLTLRTFIFNTFVYMQIFNQVNCRTVDGSLNVFKGIHRNYYFCGIFVAINVLQVIITQYGGQVFQTQGLSGGFWAASVIIGAVSLIWGFILRVIPVGVFYPCIWVVKTLRSRVEEKRQDGADPTAVLAMQQLQSAGHAGSSVYEFAPPNAYGSGTDAQSTTTSVTATGGLPRRRSLNSMPSYDYTTREQLQARANWVSAINNVRTSLSVFQALRGTGRLDSAITTTRIAENASLASHPGSSANSSHNVGNSYNE